MLYSESHVVANPLNDIGWSKNPIIPNLEMLLCSLIPDCDKAILPMRNIIFNQISALPSGPHRVKLCLEDNTHDIYTNIEQMEMISTKYTSDSLNS